MMNGRHDNHHGPQETILECAERMGATITGRAALPRDDQLFTVHSGLDEVIRRQRFARGFKALLEAQASKRV